MDTHDVFVKTRFWRDGPFLKSCTTLCAAGNPEVFCFQVDLRPIEAALRKHHDKLHAMRAAEVSGFGDDVQIGVLPPGPDVMKPGAVLKPGQSLRSKNGRVVLRFDKDALRILVNGRESWSAPTPGAVKLVNQLDGNLVAYNRANQPVFSTVVAGGPVDVVIQNDGNLVQYTGYGQPTWSAAHGDPNKKTSFLEDVGNILAAPGKAIGAAAVAIGKSKLVQSIASATLTIIKTAGQIAAPIASLIPIPGVALAAEALKHIDDPAALLRMVTTPAGLLQTAAGMIPIPGAALAGKLVANVIPAIQASEPAVAALATAHTAFGALERGSNAKKAKANVAASAALVEKTKAAVRQVGDARAKETFAAHPAIKQKITRALVTIKEAKKVSPGVMTKAEADAKIAWEKIAKIAHDAKYSTDPAARAAAQKNMQILAIVGRARKNIKAHVENHAGGIAGVLIDAHGRQIKGRFKKDSKAPLALLYTRAGARRDHFVRVA